jgi:ammonium transporter, Amt family
VVTVLRDVTAQRRAARELSWQAMHDPLTGMVNRREFHRRLTLMLAHVDPQRPLALCYLDFDRFKAVNDTCGHAAGDELLRQLAGVIKARVRERDTAARLGRRRVRAPPRRVPRRARHANRRGPPRPPGRVRFAWDGQSFGVGVSIGIVPLTTGHGDPASLLAAADAACYAAKQAGGNRVHVLHPAGGEGARHPEPGVLSLVQRALDGGGFQLYTQAIVPLATGAAGPRVEVLLRLPAATGNALAPGVFMPVAERYHQMRAIDRWVVSAVLAHVQRAPESGFYNINLSTQSIADEGFPAFVVALLGEAGALRGQLCFEVSEVAVVKYRWAAERLIRTLREAGCSIALDDFGVTLTSLAHLRDLPIQYVKIDGRLVSGVEHDPVDSSAVEAIQHVARTLGIRTIAEGVETAATLERLRDIGVDYAQGFAVGAPQPLALAGA